jgi:hypothetical protein
MPSSPNTAQMTCSLPVKANSNWNGSPVWCRFGLASARGAGGFPVPEQLGWDSIAHISRHLQLAVTTQAPSRTCTEGISTSTKGNGPLMALHRPNIKPNKRRPRCMAASPGSRNAFHWRRPLTGSRQRQGPGHICVLCVFVGS